jgi:transcriptional regulator of arginine metabolism
MEKEPRRKLGINNEMPAVEAVRLILSEKGAGTQEDLRHELEKQGMEVNQSTVSRCLRKLGAIKTFSPTGDAFYKLPTDPTPPTVDASVSDLVTGIAHNETMVVIHTSPGSASLIARHLDHFAHEDVLGTLAGDDTIFVAPKAGRQIKKLTDSLKEFFGK